MQGGLVQVGRPVLRAPLSSGTVATICPGLQLSVDSATARRQPLAQYPLSRTETAGETPALPGASMDSEEAVSSTIPSRGARGATRPTRPLLLRRET